MFQTTNSIFNLIANSIIFFCALVFYIKFMFPEYVNKWAYQIGRIGLALLVTFCFSRVVFDANIIIKGENKYFNLTEAILALGRNFGIGMLLVYIIYLIHALLKIITSLKEELNNYKKRLRPTK